MSFFENLLSSLTGSISNIFIYMIIIALFIVGVAACILPVTRTRGRLRLAIRNIRMGKEAKRSWQENDFLGKGSLMAHWSAYLDNLFFAEGEYHNASNVEDFINEETVIYGPGRAAFADALPGLEVSIGFLGTLIGLAQGLSGFNMTNAAEAQNSIMVLIPGMRYAFMTSIFGVIGSILFTLITRAVYGSTEHTLRQFYGAMSRYAGVRSVDPLTQVAIYQQEQTALIQTMAKDLNGAFTDNIRDAIAEAVEPVNQSLRSFMTVTSKEQMRFLDAVVMRFVDRMDDTMSGQLRQFGRVLTDTNENQKRAMEALQEGLSGTQETVRDLKTAQRIAQDMARDLNEVVAQLRLFQQSAQQQSAETTEAASQMREVAKHQADYLRTVTAMQGDLSRWTETLSRTVEGMNRQNELTAKTVQSAAQELKDAGTRLETLQKGSLDALHTEMDTTMEAYREYVNQFTQRVDYLARNIGDSVAKLPEAVRGASEGLLEQVDQLTRAMEDAQQAMNDAADRMYN